MTITMKLDDKVIIHSNVHSLELGEYTLAVWLKDGAHKWYAKTKIASLEVKP